MRSLSNPFWREGPIPWISAGRLRELIHDFQPDLIHTHENAILSFQLLRLARELPRVSSCHYLPRYVTHYLRWGAPLEWMIENILWKYTISSLNQFDHAIFSTRSQQQEYIAHGLLAPSTAISNGVDDGQYVPRNGRVGVLEARYPIPPGPRILFVGRLMKDKKIDLLIRAMSHVASVVEVQSIPALQALATALPVVAVDSAALPELVRTGENGFLVTPDDPKALGEALLQVLRDPDRATRMGQASLAIARDHSQAETFRKYEQFYQGLAGWAAPVTIK